MLALGGAAAGFRHEDAGDQFAVLVRRGAEGEILPVAELAGRVVGACLVRAEEGDGDGEFLAFVFVGVVRVVVFYPAGVAEEAACGCCASVCDLDALEVAVYG